MYCNGKYAKLIFIVVFATHIFLQQYVQPLIFQILWLTMTHLQMNYLDTLEELLLPLHVTMEILSLGELQADA